MINGLGSLYGLVSMATCVVMTTASAGDKSWLFHRCMWDCNKQACRDETKISKGFRQFNHDETEFQSTQPWYMQWLQWSCKDDCDYHCMWHTVEELRHDNNPVPQFHGKWPFVRFYGMQEPASVLFSILNGLPHIYMIHKIRQTVSPKSPMYNVWHMYAMVGINTWFWSAVFHARDKPFTELMDYCCAFSSVVFSFCTLWLRILGTENRLMAGSVATVFLSLYVYHVRFLVQGRIDYSYNMKVNVATGLLTSACWLTWCFRRRREQPYVWKAAIVSIAVVLLLSLELGEFPPYMWIFDAHSLWHAGTVWLPFLWYSFVIDDCHYLMNQQNKQLKVTETSGDTGDVNDGVDDDVDDMHRSGVSSTSGDNNIWMGNSFNKSLYKMSRNKARVEARPH
ncbi:hypothetical protein NP493_846g00028 [Ridgeia piscesae]|uniref:Post-GPI attachment to proteins factor 3 n=1 Tax=Ridgeia piscesae TaxID=27915 RepID=A0AAD9NMK5_RIDPI|nr:hypothetical protein NP493_846g00028 [Ridgeia piscesae]